MQKETDWKMIFNWSFFVVLSVLLRTSQALLTAPLPEFTHGISNIDSMVTDDDLIRDQMSRQQVVSEDEILGTNNRTKETVYVIEFETEPDEKEEVPRKRGKDGTLVVGESQSPLDPWSIVWYIGSFGGLVAFFLIVSCSEWCCRRGARPITVPYIQRGEVISSAQGVTETPPPPYHLFAPPPYDSINYADLTDKASGEKLDIYVISMPIQSPVNQVPA
ncbi:uncharacterized protein LOC117178038 [Belonocnema kinseyi]|uniref:uncharacterized protein LOC117178038 n=1 Tax=Belonocnema kinseyi TaxID=2817044 RepID=UPI00143DB3EE|nr:uncharacterized protein LOC117178038 [Belonocnema kinseyi]